MKRFCLITASAILAILVSSHIASAQYSSGNYKSNEVFFGIGGDNNQSSANYKAQTAAGVLGVGRYSSANYQAYSVSILQRLIWGRSICPALKPEPQTFMSGHI
jgi:hypothetical protein